MRMVAFVTSVGITSGGAVTCVVPDSREDGFHGWDAGGDDTEPDLQAAEDGHVDKSVAVVRFVSGDSDTYPGSVHYANSMPHH